MNNNTNLMLYSSFSRMLPSVNLIQKYFGIDTANAKVLFVPFADPENKYYIALSKQALMLAGINKSNISTLTSHTHKTQQFDIIFVSGGNVCRLKETLEQIDWLGEIKNRINSGVLYIGDSAGAVILGKTIKHTLEYEPYEHKLDNYDGYNIIDKGIVVHFSPKKYSNGKIVKDLDCYNAHIRQTEILGKKNFFTIKNNQVVLVKNNKIKNKFFTYHKILKSVLQESAKYHKK